MRRCISSVETLRNINSLHHKSCNGRHCAPSGRLRLRRASDAICCGHSRCNLRYALLMPPSERAPSLETPGEALRRLRERKGHSVREVSQALGWSSSKLSRIETSTSGLKAEDLNRLLDYYEPSSDVRGDIGAMARRPLRRPRRHTRNAIPDAYGRYADLEARATHIQTYGAIVVPGLLQTPEYASAIIAHRPLQDENFAATRMQTRMLRQAVLARQPPLQLSVVLDEAVLRRPIGNLDIMRRQMIRLQEMNDKDEITIRVLPFAAGAHPALTGQFAILHFSEADLLPPHVYCDGLTGGSLRGDLQDVTTYQACFDTLLELSRPANESAHIFQTLADGDWSLVL
jgi:transcriptional regulator with XRE-family HTH domain